jgi:hypothetical protein
VDAGVRIVDAHCGNHGCLLFRSDPGLRVHLLLASELWRCSANFLGGAVSHHHHPARAPVSCGDALLEFVEEVDSVQVLAEGCRQLIYVFQLRHLERGQVAFRKEEHW